MNMTNKITNFIFQENVIFQLIIGVCTGIIMYRNYDTSQLDNKIFIFVISVVNAANLFFAVKSNKNRERIKQEIEEEIRWIESRYYSQNSSFSSNTEILRQSSLLDNQKAQSCYYFSGNTFLPCAIDPKLNCSDCKDYKDRTVANQINMEKSANQIAIEAEAGEDRERYRRL